MAETDLRIKITGDASGATAVLAGTNEQINALKVNLRDTSDEGQKLPKNLEEGGKAASYSMMEARHSVMLLGEEMGVRVPRAVSSLIAGIAPLGPLLQAAFPILGAIALVEVIEKIIDHFEKAAEEAAKFATEQADVQSKAELTSQSLELENLKLEDQIAKLEGRPTTNKLREELLAVAVAAGQVSEQLSKTLGETLKTFSDVGTWEKLKATFTDMTGSIKDDTFSKMDAAIKGVKDSLTLLTAAQKEKDALPTEANEKAYADALAATQATMQRSLGVLKEYDDGTEQNKVRIHDLEMAISQLGEAHDSLAKKAEAAKDKQVIAADEAAKAQTEAAKKAIDEYNKIIDAQAKYEESLLRDAQAQNELTNAQQQFAEKAQSEDTKAWLAQLKAGEEAAKKLKASMEELAAAQDKLAEETAVAPLKAQEEQLKRLAALHPQMEREVAAQLAAIYKQEADAAIAADDAKMARLQTNITELQSQTTAAAVSGDATRLAELQAELNKELAEYTKYETEKVKLEQDAQNKIAALQDEQTKGVDKYVDKASSEFSSLFTNVITGHETMGKAVTQVLDRMLQAFIQYIVRSLAEHAIGTATHEVLNKAEQASSASTGAAAAGASAAETPVIGWTLAAEAAAAVFAALSAFDTGGMVDTTGLAMVHEHEAVLTPAQTETLKSAADSGSMGGGDTHIHNHTHNWSAIDGNSVKSFFKSNSTAFGDAINSSIRRGHVNLQDVIRGK